jgi:hypothetical protein
MRTVLLIVTSFLSLLPFAQKPIKPTIVVLEPNQTKFDAGLMEEIKGFNYKLNYSPAQEKESLDSFSKNEKNDEMMDVAEFHFRKQMNYASHYTLTLYSVLYNAVFPKADNCLVIPAHHKTNGTLALLSATAKKYNVQWVVNTVSLQSYIKDGDKYSKARIQVYDAVSNKIVLDKEYTGDSKASSKNELTCDKGELECTINNIVNTSLNDILSVIFK